MKNEFFVLDTNILISAFLFKQSIVRKAFDKAIESGKIAVSLETFDEFSEVLLRPKFDKYISSESKLFALNELKSLITFFKIIELIQVCRDPKDNKFLELAVAANASCIITGDNDLLVLNPFRNIAILNAVDFIDNF